MHGDFVSRRNEMDSVIYRTPKWRIDHGMEGLQVVGSRSLFRGSNADLREPTGPQCCIGRGLLWFSVASSR